MRFSTGTLGLPTRGKWVKAKIISKILVFKLKYLMSPWVKNQSARQLCAPSNECLLNIPVTRTQGQEL